MIRPEKTNAIEKPKTKPQERVGELKANEKKILDNLLETIKWFENYEATCFGLDENVADKDPELEKYLKDFYKEFRNFEQPAEAQKVEAEARNSDIVFLGDRHNLRRNQEFSAEFIERAAQPQSGQAVLALEFISPKHQKAIEEFMSGQIDEELFLKRSHFLEWGDMEHWPGYKKILETAKKLGIKVYGIKFQAESGEQDLEDKFFAEKIAAIAEKHPQAKLFVHIGDAHLSGNHLPKALSQIDRFRNKKSTTVLQNIRPLYFSALRRYENFQIPKILKIKSRTYNFITAPLITEIVSDIENLKQFAGKTEGEIDIWSDVMGAEIVAGIRRILGIKITEKVEGLNLPPSDFYPSFYSEEEFETLLEKSPKSLPKEIREQYTKTLEEKGCVYIPKVESRGKIISSNSLIIKRFRLKRIIEELAKFVIDPKGEKGDISNLQYFCSKLFIPERRPEGKKEEAGEKVFLDFLAGKQPALP
ncbi:MAG: ChaN family lipoprotein [Candidatus Yanofskybacteria bacterium]|nr:ChaN family lipoprotein [Candidatus Yanofskybacteria bacterium]